MIPDFTHCPNAVYSLLSPRLVDRIGLAAPWINNLDSDLYTGMHSLVTLGVLLVPWLIVDRHVGVKDALLKGRPPRVRGQLICWSSRCGTSSSSRSSSNSCSSSCPAAATSASPCWLRRGLLCRKQWAWPEFPRYRKERICSCARTAERPQRPTKQRLSDAVGAGSLGSVVMEGPPPAKQAVRCCEPCEQHRRNHSAQPFMHAGRDGTSPLRLPPPRRLLASPQRPLRNDLRRPPLPKSLSLARSSPLAALRPAGLPARAGKSPGSAHVGHQR